MSSGVKIGNQDFSASDIQKSVDEILKARLDVDTSQMDLAGGAELLRNQAQFVIVSVVLDKIAVDEKLVITEADIFSNRAEIISQVGGEDELPEALVRSNLATSDLEPYIRVRIILETLQGKYIAAGLTLEQAAQEVNKLVVLAATELGVEVNPKYGKWNPISAAIEVSDSTDGAVTPLTK